MADDIFSLLNDPENSLRDALTPDLDNIQAAQDNFLSSLETGINTVNRAQETITKSSTVLNQAVGESTSTLSDILTRKSELERNPEIFNKFMSFVNLVTDNGFDKVEEIYDPVILQNLADQEQLKLRAKQSELDTVQRNAQSTIANADNMVKLNKAKLDAAQASLQRKAETVQLLGAEQAFDAQARQAQINDLDDQYNAAQLEQFAQALKENPNAETVPIAFREIPGLLIDVANKKKLQSANVQQAENSLAMQQLQLKQTKEAEVLINLTDKQLVDGIGKGQIVDKSKGVTLSENRINEEIKRRQTRNLEFRNLQNAVTASDRELVQEQTNRWLLTMPVNTLKTIHAQVQASGKPLVYMDKVGNIYDKPTKDTVEVNPRQIKTAYAGAIETNNKVSESIIKNQTSYTQAKNNYDSAVVKVEKYAKFAQTPLPPNATAKLSTFKSMFYSAIASREYAMAAQSAQQMSETIDAEVTRFIETKPKEQQPAYREFYDTQQVQTSKHALNLLESEAGNPAVLSNHPILGDLFEEFALGINDKRNLENSKTNVFNPAKIRDSAGNISIGGSPVEADANELAQQVIREKELVKKFRDEITLKGIQFGIVNFANANNGGQFSEYLNKYLNSSGTRLNSKYTLNDGTFDMTQLLRDLTTDTQDLQQKKLLKDDELLLEKVTEPLVTDEKQAKLFLQQYAPRNATEAAMWLMVSNNQPLNLLANGFVRFNAINNEMAQKYKQEATYGNVGLFTYDQPDIPENVMQQTFPKGNPSISETIKPVGDKLKKFLDSLVGMNLKDKEPK